MRRNHPDLWCKATGIEKITNEERKERGKGPIYLYAKDKPLESIINYRQSALPGLEEIEFPPCQCGL